MRTTSQIFSAIAAPAKQVTPSSSIGGNIFSVNQAASINPRYVSPAKFPLRDVSKIVERAAIGLTPDVRSSFNREMHPDDSSIGVVGWSFRQNGLGYACLIKDKLNNDEFDIGVEIPYGQRYLHRANGISIAEKAHVVAMVHQMLPENERGFLVWQFGELEKACSNPAVGRVVEGPHIHRSLITANGITAHFALRFPDDTQYLNSPDPTLVALEWTLGSRHNLIDFTHDKYLFMKGDSSNLAGPHTSMSQDEALETLKGARILVQNNPRLNQVISARTWEKLDAAAKRLTSASFPVPVL